MKKNLLALLALLLSTPALRAQTLPPVEVPVHSRNYHDICQQLDAYFRDDYRPTEAEAECLDNPLVKYARWKWFWRDRVMPDGSFPEPAEVWLEGQKHFGSGGAQRGGPTWLNEGPTYNPSGGYWGMGRTKHVAMHPHDPNTLYVGTPDGGLWKTTDGAKTWAALGDGLPYLPVSVILLDHQHPDTLYISLGDKGGWWMRNLGIYKSTDGGLSWTPTALSWKLSDNRVLYNVVMHPANPQILLGAANFGIVRSQDGGDTWETLRTGEFTDIEFRAGSDSVLYAAQHDYWGTSQLIRSTDGGQTWQQRSNFNTTQNDIRINVGSKANADYVGLRFSNGKRFLLSKDGGLTFEDRSEMPEADHLAFSPTDTNIVYTSGVVVHRSTDQGKTWNAITHWYNDGIHTEVHADVHDIVPNPYNPEEIYFCNDGGLYRYHEPTETWQDLSSGLGIAQFYRIAMSETGPMRLTAGSQDNGGWLRNSAGVWKHTNGGDAMCQAIDPTNANIIYTEYYGGTAIYRSMDNYFSSVEISNNLPNNPSGDWVTPFILNPLNPKTFLVGMNEIYRSYDRGDHFETLTDSLTGSVDNKLRDLVMSSADTNIIAATWSNRVLRSTDGGKTWLTKGLPGNEDAPRIEIDPRNPQRMWVCRSGFSSNQKVFRTLNGGQLWFNISTGLPNVPVHCILYDSLTNYLFVGTEIGVFHTDADVINWQPYGTGMPAVIVLDLKVRQKNRRLFVGTHGRGVYSIDLQKLSSSTKEEDAGQQASVFPNPARTALFFRSESEELVEGRVQVFDATGRLVLLHGLSGQPLRQVMVDISGLSAGLYTVRVQTQQGQALVAERVVVMR